jgi:NAD(P)H-flavin reductase
LHVFVGARRRDDLYPVEHLRRLVNDAGRGGKVRVHGVVSDDPFYPGYRGRVEQVVPGMQNWAELGVDVLIAGPNAMIAATVHALTAVGVPAEKIRFDQFDATY